MEATSFREEQLHASLVRPVLLGGGERTPVMLNGLTIFLLLIGVGLHPFTITVALLLAFGVHPLLAVAARYDPQLSQVYLRHVLYQSVYQAQAHPLAPPMPLPSYDSIY